MSVNFNGINASDTGNLRTKNDAVTQTQKGVSPQAKATAETTAAKAQGDQVSFSSQAQSLKELEGSIRKLPEVDQDKVARIKAALANGSYQIDNQKLASNLLSFEEEIH